MATRKAGRRRAAKAHALSPLYVRRLKFWSTGYTIIYEAQLLKT